MSDIKVGDDVVLAHYMEDGGHPRLPPIGHVGTVTMIGRPADGGTELGLILDNWDSDCGMNVRMFRKVQRRDLQVWLATENTIPNPNPRPVPHRVRESVS